MSILERYCNKSTHIKNAIVQDECIQIYSKINSRNSPISFVTFKFNHDQTSIVINTVGKSNETPFSEFTNSFTNNEVAWGLINIEYQTTSKGMRSKLLFITWVPDDMQLSSFKETIKMKTQAIVEGRRLRKEYFRSFDSVVQANDFDEISLDYLLSKASKHERDEIDRQSVDVMNCVH